MESKALQKPEYLVLFGISLAHLFNDFLQAVIPAMYPYFEQKFSLTMSEIGLITLFFQLSASIFQPLVGNYTDRHPKPFSQIIGMTFTGFGVLTLGLASNFYWLLLAVVLVGVGSSIFHPESSRLAYMSSGGRRSFAQSVFQIGGNFGSSLAPLMIALVVIPRSQAYILWFILVVLCAQVVLTYLGRWYRLQLRQKVHTAKKILLLPDLSKGRANVTVLLLLLLVISKYFYMASISSYFQFYTIAKFGVSHIQAQVLLFYFLISIAVGTLIGGLLGDRIGRRLLILISVFGAAPFSLMLPHSDLFWTGILISLIGLLLSSAFPAIIVFAQELLPKKLGMVSGFFYGFAFGMGGLGSALLGLLADYTSIAMVYRVCSFLPLLGVCAYFLPDMRKIKYKEA